MVAWQDDINLYAKRRKKDPKKIEKILINKGWEPVNYTTEMKNALFDFLDKWYTLSIKELPKPATQRTNPISFILFDKYCLKKDSIKTIISNGKVINSKPKNAGYISIVFDVNSHKIIKSFFSRTLVDLILMHYDLVEYVRRGKW